MEFFQRRVAPLNDHVEHASAEVQRHSPVTGILNSTGEVGVLLDQGGAFFCGSMHFKINDKKLIIRFPKGNILTVSVSAALCGNKCHIIFNF